MLPALFTAKPSIPPIFLDHNENAYGPSEKVRAALAEAPSDRVVSEPAKMPALPVTLVWRAAARRQPALTRLAALLTAAGTRVGARLKKN